MSGFYIRLYQDSDYHIVRDIFARGTKEHVGAALCHSLCLPRVCVPSLVVTWLPLQITGSLLISILTAISILGLVWYLHSRIFAIYVDLSLRDDMLDIKKYYLQSRDCCFWVVEWHGQIVGTVAAAPLLQPGGERKMELRRLSVPRSYRRRGIGRALCNTVINFTRKRGYKTLVLETSPHQTSAAILYEKMGFRKSTVCYPDDVYSRYMDLIDVSYQYDIPDPNTHDVCQK